ncbi:MAG: hypothetical protein WC413_03795 [Candidatus Nanoarchaeia archaeon]
MRRSKFRKEMDERDKRRKLFNSIIVSSMTEENSIMPTLEKYVLSEFIDGTISFLGGKARKIAPEESRYDFDNKYAFKLEEYFKKELKKVNKKLPSKLEKDLLIMIHPEIENSGFQASDAHVNCELYEFVRGPGGGGLFGYCMHSRNSISYDKVMKIKKEMKNYNSKTLEIIKGIGKAMRPFMNQDIKSISKTHSW